MTGIHVVRVVKLLQPCFILPGLPLFRKNKSLSENYKIQSIFFLILIKLNYGKADRDCVGARLIVIFIYLLI